ncbi:MAG: hypothetical protein C0483_18640 [Pirellula sp.]|nr:hypothetical protein [Pirellula sp.]
MADNLPPLFGRSMFDRQPNEEAITIDALLGATPKERPRFTAPPFRKGQLVRQTHGPGVEANQRAVVEDVKFLNNVSGFTGWAIKLVGRPKPFAASFFEAMKENPDPQPGDYAYVDEEIASMPEIRVARFVGGVNVVYLDDKERCRFSDVEMLATGGLRALSDLVIVRAGVDARTSMNITLRLMRAATGETINTLPPQRPEQEPTEAPTPANGKRRRIVRPGEQG